MQIKTDIESALEIALGDARSIFPQYDDFDDPCNWVPFSGCSINDFEDGEIVLMAWDASERIGGDSYYDWTFREVDLMDRTFRRKGGLFSEPRDGRWNEYYIYRYQECATDETELSSASLEEIL